MFDGGIENHPPACTGMQEGVFGRKEGRKEGRKGATASFKVSIPTA